MQFFYICSAMFCTFFLFKFAFLSLHLHSPFLFFLLHFPQSSMYPTHSSVLNHFSPFMQQVFLHSLCLVLRRLTPIIYFSVFPPPFVSFSFLPLLLPSLANPSYSSVLLHLLFSSFNTISFHAFTLSLSPLPYSFNFLFRLSSSICLFLLTWLWCLST